MRFLIAIITKELRTILRSRKAFFMLLLILLFSGGIFVISWANLSHLSSLSDRAQLSRMLFTVMTFVELVGLGLISPIMTATAITTERENKTLELLTNSPIPRPYILAGKWFAAIFFQILIVVCLLPCLSLSFQLGGVSLGEYLFVALVIAITVCTYGMIGLANSTRFRRTSASLFSSLLMVFFIATFLPFGLMIFIALGFSALKNLSLLLLFLSLPMTILSLLLINFKKLQRFRTLFIFAFLFFLIAALYLISTNFTRFGNIVDNNFMSRIYQQLLPISPLYTVSTAATIFFSPRSGGTSGTLDLLLTPTFRNFVLYQASFFLFATLVAWRGMVRLISEKATIAKVIIDDKKTLKQRRRTWPFYLIDPQQRKKEIGDAKSPIYIKELLVGTLVKGRILVRLAYVACFFSLIGCAFQFLGSDNLDWAKALNTLAISIVLPFIPIVASTLVSKEREENTMDLLRTTLISSEAIIRGKLRVALRFLITLFLCVFILPYLFYVGLPSYDHFNLLDLITHSTSTLYLLLKISIPMVSFIILYSSICLLFSSCFKKNVSAIVVSYLFIPFLLISPVLFILLLESTELFKYGSFALVAFWIEDITPHLVGALSPLLSPYLYLFPIDESDAISHNYFIHFESLRQVILHSILLLSLSFGILKLAARRLETAGSLKA